MAKQQTSRNEVAKIVRDMISGSLNYLQGAEQLVELRENLGIYANDPDFVVFVAVLSEIQYLRGCDGTIDWNQQKTGRFSKEIQQSIEWAKEVSWDQCLALSKRYSD